MKAYTICIRIQINVTESYILSCNGNHQSARGTFGGSTSVVAVHIYPGHKSKSKKMERNLSKLGRKSTVPLHVGHVRVGIRKVELRHGLLRAPLRSPKLINLFCFLLPRRVLVLNVHLELVEGQKDVPNLPYIIGQEEGN